MPVVGGETLTGVSGSREAPALAFRREITPAGFHLDR